MTGKAKIEKFETESDPEYIKAEWKLKEVEGEQFIDCDFYILKNIANIMVSFILENSNYVTVKRLIEHCVHFST